MNEAGLLIYLLTRRKNDYTIGMNEKDLLNKLSLTDKNGKFKLLNLLEELDANLSILGLQIKFNPSNEHWFISFIDSIPKMASFYSEIGLSPKIAATLMCILILSFSKGNSILMEEVSNLRKKKTIKDDIEELEKAGYIFTNKGNLTLTPKLFYYIDIECIMENVKDLGENIPKQDD